jgi:hypothetical protein
LNASGDGAFKAGDVTLAANYQVMATGFVIDPFTNTLVPPTASVTVGAGAAIELPRAEPRRREFELVTAL